IKLVKRAGQVLAMQVWVGGGGAECPEAQCSQQHGGGAMGGLEVEKAHHATSLRQGGWRDGVRRSGFEPRAIGIWYSPDSHGADYSSCRRQNRLIIQIVVRRSFTVRATI